MDGWMDGWIVGWMDLSASDVLQYMYCCRPTLYLICCTLVSTCISPHYHFTANYFWHTIIAYSVFSWIIIEQDKNKRNVRRLRILTVKLSSTKREHNNDQKWIHYWWPSWKVDAIFDVQSSNILEEWPNTDMYGNCHTCIIIWTLFLNIVCYLFHYIGQIAHTAVKGYGQYVEHNSFKSTHRKLLLVLKWPRNTTLLDYISKCKKALLLYLSIKTFPNILPILP